MRFQGTEGRAEWAPARSRSAWRVLPNAPTQRSSATRERGDAPASAHALKTPSAHSEYDAEERLTRPPVSAIFAVPADAHEADAGTAPTWALASPGRGLSRVFCRSLHEGVSAMNSAERAHSLQPSAATPVDGDSRPEPEAEPKDSTPEARDALSDVLQAMRDAVERREPTPGGRDRLSNVGS
jgi:hypothetical protein